MCKTIKSKFIVKHINNKEICLLEKNNSLTVFVESINNPKYNDEMRQKISRVTKGSIINASLKSQNKLCTIWIVDEIKFI